jgi:hypothetical protein
MSPTVWCMLNRATIRVPSASLSCIDANGRESSTTMPIDLEAAGGTSGVGAELSSVEDPPPRVLPTPWKRDWGFMGS